MSKSNAMKGVNSVWIIFKNLYLKKQPINTQVHYKLLIKYYYTTNVVIYQNKNNIIKKNKNKWIIFKIYFYKIRYNIF